MYAVIGRVNIKPGKADETLAMISGGVDMIHGMGSVGGYWARSQDQEGDLIQQRLFRQTCSRGVAWAHDA